MKISTSKLTSSKKDAATQLAALEDELENDPYSIPVNEALYTAARKIIMLNFNNKQCLQQLLHPAIFPVLAEAGKENYRSACTPLLPATAAFAESGR